MRVSILLNSGKPVIKNKKTKNLIHVPLDIIDEYNFEDVFKQVYGENSRIKVDFDLTKKKESNEKLMARVVKCLPKNGRNFHHSGYKRTILCHHYYPQKQMKKMIKNIFKGVPEVKSLVFESYKENWTIVIHRDASDA